ncbi:MAG: metal-dependent hydrolase [Pseudomonadales bacterium]|nr:metal-dependent hydrolase [Pseudomonadales bacterium]
MALVNRKIGYDEVETRDLKFHMDATKVSRHWFNEDPWLTHFMNSILSVVPDGERWVMQSVRKQLDRLTDPAVRKAGIEFIHQERIHAREHDLMNKAGVEHGVPLDKIENVFTVGRKFLQKHMSVSMQGAFAAAGEHFTATLSSVMLEHPEIMHETHHDLKSMLYWHFVEETEHKSVSFDVFTDAAGNGKAAYLKRILAMGSIGVLGLPMMSVPFFYLLWSDKELTNIESARRMVHTLFVDPGVMSKFGRMFLPYFHPDFHPWDDDNRAVIHAWKREFDRTGGDTSKAFDALVAWLEENPDAIDNEAYATA